MLVRGNTESGEPLKWEDVKGHVVVYHFGSVYVESSLRSQYPGESGILSQMLKLYGDRGLMCIWVLPEGEGKGDAARMALDLCPDLPVGVRVGQEDVMPVSLMSFGGNIVVGRDGLIQTVCSDQQLFKAINKAVVSGRY